MSPMRPNSNQRRKLNRRQRVLLLSLLGATLCVVAIVSPLVRRPVREYRPDEKAEGITEDLTREAPHDHPDVRFVDIAEKAGVHFQHFWGLRSTQLPEDMGSGAAWGDFDNDGDPDLFLVNICSPLTLSDSERESSPATCKLYRNEGDGTFSDVTENVGLDCRLIGMGAAWGDCNGDGWLDIVVSSYGSLRLFKNQAGAHFVDITHAAGMDRWDGFWSGVSWADFDADGDLDLYVCGYVQYDYDPSQQGKVSLQYQAEIPFSLNPSSYRPERNLLLRNDGGRFTDVAAEMGADNPNGRSLSASWCDFNLDGKLDLYIANDISDNVMLIQRADGSGFEDVSTEAWVADYRGAMGLGVGDYDCDGDFDIFITHWIAQENALLRNTLYAFPGAERGRLVFMDVADQVGLGQIALPLIGWGTSMFDYDNDGRLDLYVSNGSTFQQEDDRSQLVPMKSQLFWHGMDNDGFFEVGASSGDPFHHAVVGRGAAFADFDDDGDIDICQVNHSGRAWLLRNDGGSRQHWLKVRVSNSAHAPALGALVRVTCGELTQMQQVGGQSSYLSQNDTILHFGVGNQTSIDRITVTFLSGAAVVKESVPADQTVVVEEPKG